MSGRRPLAPVRGRCRWGRPFSCDFAHDLEGYDKAATPELLGERGSRSASWQLWIGDDRDSLDIAWDSARQRRHPGMATCRPGAEAEAQAERQRVFDPFRY